MSTLTLTDVNAFYDRSHVLHDVSLTVEPGQMVTLLGRNGAGKTTTLRSIMGMVHVETGEIRYNGESLIDKPTEEISKLGISLVPENRRVFGTLTVEENLKMGYLGHETGAFDEQKQKIVDYFPRLGDRLDQRASQLSGGEQQMLTIGRALISDPDLILVDEPTEGLMPTLVERLQDILVEINQDGLAMLLVEQDIDFALRVSDYGYLIEEGHIVLEKPSEELTDPAIRDEYLALG